jgi:cytidylate kinase
MAVITISRQAGSGGDEIAVRVCEMLGYQYFDKSLMARVASEVAPAGGKIVDFSEADYKMRNFLARLLNRRSPRTVAEVRSWREDTKGVRIAEVTPLNEDDAIALVRSTVQAAYQQGNVVIVGRGGQAILREKPAVLHVRIEAPLDARVQRVRDQANLSLAAAREKVTKSDEAAADYLKRFYEVNWSDLLLYHLVINTGRWNTEAAAHLIVNAVSYLPSAESSN